MGIFDKLTPIQRETTTVADNPGNTDKQGNATTDPSANPSDPNVSPTPAPADNPDIATQEDKPTLLQQLRESAVHLSPSEIPAPNEIPAIVAAFVHYAENDELPKSPDENDNDGKGE